METWMPGNRNIAYLLGGLALFALADPAAAQTISREQDIPALRLGQRVKVDDGTCPAGQIKQVYGTKMTSGGVVPAHNCVPRVGPKQRR
jgi:hypothetical protein